MAAKDLPTPIRGVVKRAFDPGDRAQTFELDEPILFTGYPLRGRIFAWSVEDERGLAWSMIVDETDAEPAMAGILVGGEFQARSHAEGAFRAARQAPDGELDANSRRGASRRVS